MNKTVKKLIAREGLIIISLFSLGIIVALMPSTIVLKDTKKPMDLLTQKTLKLRHKKTGLTTTIIVDKKYIEEKVNGYDFTRADVLKELERRGKATPFAGSVIVKKELDLDYHKSTLYTLILLFYPAYLLIRFVLWAVRTIREK